VSEKQPIAINLYTMTSKYIYCEVRCGSDCTMEIPKFVPTKDWWWLSRLEASRHCNGVRPRSVPKGMAKNNASTYLSFKYYLLFLM
jgi:hypothetical protein